MIDRLEARLSAALRGEARDTKGEGVTESATEVSETSIAVVENGANVWPDEAAEAAFIAEARERGEPPSSKISAVSAVEEINAGALPALDDLVKRLPAEVRETLDDLFRAKFISVRRVPKNSLKE